MLLGMARGFGRIMVKSSDRGSAGTRWDRFAIRAEIHRRGGSLTQIAKQHGLSEAACRVALIKPCPAGERAIAKYLKVSVRTLWPDRHPARRRAARVTAMSTRLDTGAK